MPRAKCGKSTERTVDFYLTECNMRRWERIAGLAGEDKEG